jgi:hypothetical protein
LGHGDDDARDRDGGVDDEREDGVGVADDADLGSILRISFGHYLRIKL